MAASSSTRVLNEATVDSLLLVALEQFGDQATNGLLLSAFEEYENSGTTQKDTSQNVTINFKYTLFVKMYYMQSDHNKQI